MPISDRFRCILVHVPKTGGTVVERELEIPLRPENLYGVHDAAHSLGLQHLKAAQIRDRIPAHKWRTYLKIATVRNPFERLVSEFYWRLKYNVGTLPPELDGIANVKERFTAFVRLVVRNYRAFNCYDHFYPQIDFIDDPTTRASLVDVVLKQESLEDDFRRHVAPRIGYNRPQRWNRIDGTDHPHYSELYTPETRALVEQFYAADLARFEYRFESRRAGAATVASGAGRGATGR